LIGGAKGKSYRKNLMLGIDFVVFRIGVPELVITEELPIQ
jgi:hypothetical protein